MSETVLNAMRDLIQEDVNNRGLRADPDANLINAFPGDFAGACHHLAETPDAAVAILTGFYIPHGRPPAAETDGPLGALFLARALTPLGIRVVLAAEPWCTGALRAGVQACALDTVVSVIALPVWDRRYNPFDVSTAEEYLLRRFDFWHDFDEQAGRPTHLIAIERAGPSHAGAAARQESRCYTMSGVDITEYLSPAEELFYAAPLREVYQIGIGDGGNEIGMGKIPWEVIRCNIPHGDLVACQVPCHALIVSGVSNWGAYALAAGVRHLRGAAADRNLFDPEREREVLRVMVERGPLVDGVTGKQTVTVDGLPFERYAEPLRRLCKLG